MIHVKALGIKIPMVAVVLLFSGISTYSFWNTIILSLLVLAVSYIAGDLFILKMTNNTITTLSDFGVVLLMFGWQQSRYLEPVCRLD